MDLVYIDGGIGQDTVVSDWTHVRPLLHEASVVVFGDYYGDAAAGGCARVVHRLDGVSYAWGTIAPAAPVWGGRLTTSFAIVMQRASLDLLVQRLGFSDGDWLLRPT